MVLSDAVMIGLGLLTVRLVFGLMMAAHGAQKLFGWFGGRGLRATAAGFESIGFRPGTFFGPVAALVEFASGTLMALGLLEPVGPALMVSVMIVAAAAVHWKNGSFAPAGIELNLLFGAAGLGLALTGPGNFSLDRSFGFPPSRPAVAWVWLALAAIGAILVIVARRPVPTHATGR